MCLYLHTYIHIFPSGDAGRSTPSTQFLFFHHILHIIKCPADKIRPFFLLSVLRVGRKDAAGRGGGRGTGGGCSCLNR